jgi:S-adenosylmethionine/arginine decarboxylase-like enzyme
VYVDVFCCSPSFDPGACATSIQENFGTSSAKWQTINRGLTGN